MLDASIDLRLRGLASLVGNTPLLAIELRFRGQPRVIYAKAEHLNMTGSIKDRMALHILATAYARGALRPGAPIVEATSGNTGISFAAIGRALGHPVTIFMPDWMSDERKDLIRALGARTVLVSQDEGGFLGSIELAERRARGRPGAFLPRQFSNHDNVEAHAATTGPEIWWQLRFRGSDPRCLRRRRGHRRHDHGRRARTSASARPAIAVHPLEPANSPTLSTGHKVGHHRIQGISDEFIPPIVDLASLDRIVSVDDGDAILMAQKLAAELGLAVGISSGANFLGALMVQNELAAGRRRRDGLPRRQQEVLEHRSHCARRRSRDGLLAPDVELLGFRSFKRVCQTCCDPAECLADTLAAGPEGLELPACPRRG